VFPATDDRLRTRVRTPVGEFPFQQWFVARRHDDPVDRVVYEGSGSAEPAPGALEAIADADLIAIAPSNPYTSIHPIVAVGALRTALKDRRAPCVAVSPLIGGTTVKGPAASMLERLAGGTSPRHVADCYAGLIDTLVIDEADAAEAEDAGVRCIVTDTLMREAPDRRRLAEAALGAAAVST
jgi:LPPG:FO 2-phospho-L-lactate transferase